MQTHTAFFNTEPPTWISCCRDYSWFGRSACKWSTVDGETINGMRAGLMGPILDIGDSLVVGTLIPVLWGLPLVFQKAVTSQGYLLHRRLEFPSLLCMRFAFFKGGIN